MKGFLVGLCVLAGAIVPVSAGSSGGLLAQKWCSDDQLQSAEFAGGVLTLDGAGDSIAFEPVRLESCTGDQCVYLHTRARMKWVVSRRGSGVRIVGPIHPEGGRATLDLGKCR